jgi:cobalt-zinc-cadmium efflux system outer membrane protein
MFRFMSCLLIAFIAQYAHAVELNENQAIKLYLDNNLEVMATKFQIDFSKADELTAGLWANPSLLIDSQLNAFGKNWNQKNAGGPAQQDYILTVPVDVNGKRRQAVKVAKLATGVKEAEFQAFVRSGLFSMLSLLYEFQRERREYELLQEKGQLLERLVLTLEKRIGSTSSQPLIQSRARLANEDVKFDIQNNRILQAETLNKLKIFFHLSDLEDIIPNVNFKTGINETFVLNNLVETARNKRPDFVAIDILKKQLDGQLELDHKRIWSDVGVQAGFSRQSNVGARPETQGSYDLPSAWSWLVGVTLPLPIFDRNQGNILQTKLRSNQALVRERFMIETITREIDTSIKKIEITSLNLNRFKSSQLNNAKIVRDSALRQFGTGTTTLLEYLDAVNAYHVSILKFISAQYDLTTEVLKLKLLTGQEISP